MWGHWILPFFVALILASLWMLFLCPLVLRLFGLAIPLNLRKRRGMTMDEGQSVLWGVLGWGVSMIIFHMTHIYVIWLMYRIPSDKPTVWGFIETLFQWTLGGVLFGLFTTHPQKKQTVE
jgi:hypothetical protein